MKYSSQYGMCVVILCFFSDGVSYLNDEIPPYSLQNLFVDWEYHCVASKVMNCGGRTPRLSELFSCNKSYRFNPLNTKLNPICQ